jgi:oxygen tolerance protein BatD
MVTMTRTNTSPLALLLTLVLALFSPQLLADTNDLEVSVDRSQIYQDETIDLTIIGHLELKLDFGSLWNLRNLELPQPELGKLSEHFDIIDQQQKYNIQSINGKNDATIKWVYTLAPKQTGALTIPEIEHDDHRSKPISIKVLEGRASDNDGRPPLVFLEAEVDKQTAYVQEQITYTLRLYTVGQPNGDLSNPEVTDAIIEKIGDQTKDYRMRHNQRYEVIERKFLIFPQKSGELSIPPIAFNGSIIDTRARRRVRAHDTSPQIKVNVLPPAAAFTGKTWLPAISLNLSEKWDTPPENVAVGDAFTRTISIQALGLLGSALPPLFPNDKPADIDGFKQYPDQPNTESMEHQAGVQSSRTVSIAMVAVNEGAVTLPEIKIPWWDTVNQVERVAVIPSREISIGVGSSPAQANTNLAEQSKPPAPLTEDETNSSDKMNELELAANPDAESNNTLFYLVIVVLIIGWGVTTIVLLKRKPATQSNTKQATTINENTDEKVRFKLLEESIQSHSPEMQGELVKWAKLKWPERNIRSMADVTNWVEDETFASLIADAEASLYSSESAKKWDSKALLESLKEIRNKKSAISATSVLNNLYPE